MIALPLEPIETRAPLLQLVPDSAPRPLDRQAHQRSQMYELSVEGAGLNGFESAAVHLAEVSIAGALGPARLVPLKEEFVTLAAQRFDVVASGIDVEKRPSLARVRKMAKLLTAATVNGADFDTRFDLASRLEREYLRLFEPKVPRSSSSHGPRHASKRTGPERATLIAEGGILRADNLEMIDASDGLTALPGPDERVTAERIQLEGQPPMAEAQKIEETSLVLSNNQSSPIWQAAVSVEADVFVKKGYVENQGELAEEYAPYLQRSRMLALTQGAEVIAASRIIDHDPANPANSFKTVHDVRENRLEVTEEGRTLLDTLRPEETFEIGTIALNAKYEGSFGNTNRYMMQMYGAIVGIAAREGKPNIIGSFDARYFERFRKFFGPGVVALGPPTEYMGSPTVVVRLNIPEAEAYLDTGGEHRRRILDVLHGAARRIKHEH